MPRASRWWWLPVLFAAALPAQADLAALVDKLGGEDPQARSQAYNELQRTRPAGMVELLGKRIAGFPTAGQNLAVYLLDSSPIDETRPVWKRLLEQGSPLLRAAAATALWRHGDRNTGKVLAAAIAAANDQERSSILGRLWNIDDPQVVAAVRAVVRPGLDAYALASALRCLLEGSKERDAATIAAVEAVLAAGGEAQVRAVAAAFLIAVGETRHAALLATLVQDEATPLYQLQTFLDRAGRLDAALLDAFAARLGKAKNQADVNLAAGILKKHAPDRAVTALKQLLKAEEEPVRTAALQALSQIAGALDQKTLREMLAGDDVKAALVAAETLRRMDEPVGLARVLAIVAAGGQHRAEAVRVLGGFRSRSSIATLIDLLEAGDVAIRRNAWTALQRLLPDLLPYRRFDWRLCNFQPEGEAAARAEAVQKLRAFWAGVK